MAASGIGPGPAARVAEIATHFAWGVVACLLLLTVQTAHARGGQVVLAAAEYGANVATGNLQRGSPTDEIVTGWGGGDGPQTAEVRVYDLSGELLRRFFAFG